MRKNKDTVIKGKKIVLVPYRMEHVEKYHGWMQSAELRELTASEPLSLDEERAMQQTWFTDDDKCTFIVLDAETFEKTRSETEAMVGDVNLFLNDPEDRTAAEVEIMIAESTARGRGVGREACLSMMKYGVEYLNIKEYSVKIGVNNSKSISMFSKFGFKEVSRSEVFQEVTMTLALTQDVLSWLREQTVDVHITDTGPS